MRSVQLIAYTYPSEVTLMVKGVRYTYHSSEFFCRRFLNALNCGAQFNALNWFKRVSRVIKKEVAKV